MCTFDTDKIYLSWRQSRGKRRFIVGELFKENDNYFFKYCSEEILEKAKAQGFSNYPAFPDLERIYDKDVLNTFTRRLVNPARSDYDKFLKYWCAENYKDNLFAVLGLTGAKLQTDNFEFIAPHYEVPAMFYTELAGLHYSDENLLTEIKAETNYKEIILKAEPENQYDRNAVKVLYNGQDLGYIKVIHSECVFKALGKNLKSNAKIQKIIKNGSIKELLLEIKISD